MCHYEKKWCKKCGKKLQKWGKDSRGKQRFRCSFCKQGETRKRSDLTTVNHKKIFDEWIGGKNELEYFAQKYGVSTRTLNRWFTDFWIQKIEPKNLSISNQIIIIDGYVVDNDTVALLVKTVSKVIFWSFVKRETYGSWKSCLSQLKNQPDVIVCDGQKGMLKAIEELFPRVTIQRCQFHILQRNKQLLTQNPETEPAIEFKKIVDEIPKIATRNDLKIWLEQYLSWKNRYEEYLKEKTYYEFNTQYIYKNFTQGKRSWFAEFYTNPNSCLSLCIVTHAGMLL